MAQSFIPVVGPAWEAAGDLQDGDYGGAAFNTALKAEMSTIESECATGPEVRCDVVTAEGGSALERLASLVAVPDFASIYLALAHGLDPMAVPAVTEMKELSNQ